LAEHGLPVLQVNDSIARDAITSVLKGGPQNGPVLDRLLPLVYDELRLMARRHLVGERESHTLNTTALVHEAYLKLVDQTWASAEGRAYFFGAASRAMRQILVDHARHRARAKRGGSQQAIPLEEHHLVVDDFDADLLEVDTALRELASIEPRAVQVIECRFFGGLNVEETAEALGISVRTVKRDWILAKAWLYRKLGDGGRAGSA
jgi:RNA polymerase sigma factor (TIGR02999 family)